MDLKLNFKNVSFEGRGRITVDEITDAGGRFASRIKRIIIEDGNEEIPDNFNADVIIQRGGEIFGKLKAKIVNFVGGINSGIEADNLNVCCATLKGENIVNDTANLYGGSVLDGTLSVKKKLQIEGGAFLLEGSKTNVDGDTFIFDNSKIDGILNTKTLETAGKPIFSENSQITVNSEKINPKNVSKIFRRK